MTTSIRTVFDKSFSAAGYISIFLMICSLVVVLAPIVSRGSGAFIFQGTVEYRRMQPELFERGDREKIQAELASIAEIRQPIFDMLATFETELAAMPITKRLKLRPHYDDLLESLRELLGPLPTDHEPVMARDQYGKTRYDLARRSLEHVLYKIEYDQNRRDPQPALDNLFTFSHG